MYTLDASVFARDFDVRDPERATCRALLQQLTADALPIVVPVLLLAEIAGVISRERRDPIAARLAVEALKARPHIQFVTIEEQLAQSAAVVAVEGGKS